MNIKKEIEVLIQNALEKLNVDMPEKINFDHPQDLKNGDYTSNIAMILAGQNNENPRGIAQNILNNIEDNENIEKVEIAGPGYLNFYLSKKFFLENLSKKIEQKKEKEKILFEHSSPNLFKPFHIGHLVNNSIGESLSRIFRFAGNKVINISFPSDVSPGIAKTIWAIKKNNIDVKNLTLIQIADAYVFGTKEYKENEMAKEEIDKINIEIYSKEEGEDWDIYEKGKNISLEHFKEITKKLGSKFTDIIYESEAEVVGKDIVRKHMGDVFVESQGAIIFEGSKHGLFDNVFINNQNFGTYLTKDVGLLKIKKEVWGDFDKSFVITDNEQKQHFQLIKKAASLIDEVKDFAEKSEYLQHGKMSFAGNIKISSRYGNVPLAIDVIEMVQKNILEKMKERDFSQEEKQEISEKLAIATLKYSILKITSGKNIVFDLEKETNPQGNSAPYILYSLVRAKSIFRNLEDVDLNSVENKKGIISALERKLYLFTEVVEKSELEYSPHYLANYIYDLASEFNSFYAETKILDKDNEDYTYNLSVVKKYQEIMEKSLELLAIETVEKM